MIIIHGMRDGCHAQNSPSLILFNEKLYNFSGEFDRTQRQYPKHFEVTMTSQTSTSQSHMPKDSVLFERIIPVVLIVLGLITTGLMLFAAGVVLGIVHF